MKILLFDESRNASGLASIIRGHVVVACSDSAISSSDTTTGVSETLKCLGGSNFMYDVSLDGILLSDRINFGSV